MVGTNLESKIKERAYQIWEREGRPHGKHLEHWRRAEQEVKERAEEGVLTTTTGDREPAPRMSPASPAAAEPTASETATTAKEAKRAVKRKQTATEGKASRARKPKASTPKPTT